MLWRIVSLALPLFTTVGTGASISFLSFGAIVDIKSALMFTAVFHRRMLLVLLPLPFVLTLLIGAVIAAYVGDSAGQSATGCLPLSGERVGAQCLGWRISAIRVRGSN